MGLRDRLLDLMVPSSVRSEWPGLTWQQYAEIVSFGGNQYLTSGLSQTIKGHAEEIDGSYAGLVEGAYKTNGIVFAVMLARRQLFTEARFQFQQLRNGRPGALFGDPSLSILETPWPNGNTADLLARMIDDADLGGNSFNVRRDRKTIRRLRPDWVDIILGSERDDSIQAGDVDAEVLGYRYHQGGRNSGREVVFFLPEEVAHWAPIPDPLAWFRGMSWLTPVIREIMADKQMTDHKSQYLVNGATPNLTVAIDKDLKEAANPKAFGEWVETFKKTNPTGGQWDKFKTWYLAGGTTVTKVGGNMQEVDFKVVQGAGETRIAAAGGVPPIIAGFSEGLAAATYANYGQARRRFADNTMRPLWRGAAGALEDIVPAPAGSRLWYDDRDIQALAEDKKDLAEVHALEAQQMRTLIDAGFDPDAVVEFISTGDPDRLKGNHSGLYSVQLQPPMPDGPPKPEPAPVAPPIPKRDEALFGLLARAMDRPQPDNHLHLDAGAFVTNNHAPDITFPEGFVRAGDTHVSTPEVHIEAPVTVEPTQLTIAEGAFQVAAPEVRFEDGALTVVERTPLRTVVDFDDEGEVVGSHEERITDG